MTIDTCYEGIIAKLTAQRKILEISTEFFCLKTNHEKTLYVYDILKDYNAFPKLLKISKDVDKSTNYRNQGNQHFKNSNNYLALQYYNLSLLYAPKNSDNYSLAISNRSIVLYELGKYKECLTDVENLLATKHPEQITEKLKKRQSLSLNALKQEKAKPNSMNDLTTMKGARNEHYPCASSKLDVIFSEEMGRHVVAKEDIGVGEVLACEEPYLVLSTKSQYLFSCNYCLSRSGNLLPCDECCFALYCSDKCKEEAWKYYHSVECSLMATLIKEEFTKLELKALRTVIKARYDHEDWQTLFKTIQDTEKDAKTIKFGSVKENDKWVYDSKYYNAIHALETNLDKRDMSDLFQKGTTAAVFLYLLKEHTKFLKSDSNDNEKEIINCIAGLLLHHEMTVPTNMHNIQLTTADKNGNYVEELIVGGGPYAFHSLINHSCAPNVVRMSHSGSRTMTLLALRPIKKGTQLLDNYGPHHALEDYSQRQKQLKFQYRFKCQCEACTDNWPQYFSLPSTPSQSLRRQKNKLLTGAAIESLQKGDVKIALKLIKPLCKLCEDLEPFAPCQELADCQETFKQCLAIFGGILPIGYSIPLKNIM